MTGLGTQVPPLGTFSEKRVPFWCPFLSKSPLFFKKVCNLGKSGWYIGPLSFTLGVDTQVFLWSLLFDVGCEKTSFGRVPCCAEHWPCWTSPWTCWVTPGTCCPCCGPACWPTAVCGPVCWPVCGPTCWPPCWPRSVPLCPGWIRWPCRLPLPPPLLTTGTGPSSSSRSDRSVQNSENFNGVFDDHGVLEGEVLPMSSAKLHLWSLNSKWMLLWKGWVKLPRLTLLRPRAGQGRDQLINVYTVNKFIHHNRIITIFIHHSRHIAVWTVLTNIYSHCD